MTQKNIALLTAVLTALGVIVATWQLSDSGSEKTVQKSLGNNSPNISNVSGSVSINN